MVTPFQQQCSHQSLSPSLPYINTAYKQTQQESQEKAFTQCCCTALSKRKARRRSQAARCRCGAVQGNVNQAQRQPLFTMLEGCRQHKRPSKAAQQVVAASKVQGLCSRNLTWQEGAVSRSAKEQLLKQRGCVIWFTGLSGSGKSTVAITLEHALAASGRLTMLLDGDNVRHGLNCNLGFSAQDREENIRRIGEVAKLMMETGIVTLTSLISPYEKDRQMVRSRMPPGDFIEVHMDVPLEICEARDTKGLYRMARAGKIRCFTGIDDPYEPPKTPEITLHHLQPDGTANTPDDMAATILDYLQEHGILKEALAVKAET